MMPPELLLKLQKHFNSAAERYPAAKALFKETLDACALDEILFYKGLAYKVGQIEDLGFEDGRKVMNVFWDAGKMIREHKGPGL